MGFLKSLLQHPLTKGMNLDDPETTRLRKQIIQEKPLLKSIYKEWYTHIFKHLPPVDGPVLELGSGAGFLNTYIPKLVTSDIMPVEGNNIACDALDLPFKEKSLRAIVLINVLHHIADPELFFTNAAQHVKKDGVIIMIEPWITPWSRIVYTKLHHEPFEPENPSWKLPASGPLSGGNDALPWIIFQRDREQFKRQENWRIQQIQPIMPLRYLLSGGVSMRNLQPGWMVPLLTFMENKLPQCLINHTAMFALIVVERR